MPSDPGKLGCINALVVCLMAVLLIPVRWIQLFKQGIEGGIFV